MRKIGIVASGSSETRARVILNEGEEKTVKVEDLVLIKNQNGNDVFAVCREGMGSNDNLKTGSYSPGVAYARRGRKPSSAKEFYDFKLSFIGDVTTSLQQNKLIIAPCSDVYVFEDKDNPMAYLGSGDITVGYYKEHPDWNVPVDAKFIPYHIGVFSVTGGGKSFLARYELIPLFRKAGYDALIFDWKGSDYVPHFDKVINFSEIALDEDVVVSYLTSKMDYFGYTGENKFRNAVRDALEDAIYETEWREKPSQDVKKFLEQNVVRIIRAEHLDRQGNVDSWGRRYIRKFRKALRKLEEKDFENILGKLTPDDILSIVKEAHVAVIDVSQTGKDEKLSIFLSIAKHLRELMEKKERLNLALLIDEGPQYCPFRPRGLEYDTTEMISQLCALGRSYCLSVVLLSQGMAGEIGINASIRRNLNTQFIGKIHPLDVFEASQMLSALDLDPNFLVSLPEGHFYFLGNMNPSPVPLLITFSIEEEVRPNESSTNRVP